MKEARSGHTAVFLVPVLLAHVAGTLEAQRGLKSLRTKEALVKSNASRAVSLAVGRRVDEFCVEFGAFYSGFGLRPKSNNTIVVRLFNTYDEYEDYYKRTHQGRSAPTAYFSPSLNALVLYNDEADITLRQTLFHESSHQFLRRYTNDAPKWLNEGLAEYFEGWRMTPEGRLVERRPNLYDTMILQDAIKRRRALAPEKLVSMSASQFTNFRANNRTLHGYLHYVTSWSLVWHCLEGGVEEDRERFVKYLTDLNRRGPRARFEVEDWEAFEERWRKTVLALGPEPQDAIDHIVVARRYLDNGEYSTAIAEYEAALEKDPETPRVHYWLGYGYKLRNLYDDAVKWLKKAREVEPDNPAAPYQLARIWLRVDLRGSTMEPEPDRALVHALEASRLTKGSNPNYEELLARCYLAQGDFKRALAVARRIPTLVEDDEDRLEHYENLITEIRVASRGDV